MTYERERVGNGTAFAYVRRSNEAKGFIRDERLVARTRHVFSRTESAFLGGLENVVAEERAKHDIYMPLIAEASDLNRVLFGLRKASKLDVPSTKRSYFDHDEYAFASEIAARHLEDKYKVSLDEILCDPRLRAEFDGLAKDVCPDVACLQLRLAALGLRKARKLRPEIVKRLLKHTRVSELTGSDVKESSKTIPAEPGVYIIRDQTEGYLYIGQAGNLRLRLRKHIEHSDRKELARYFWANGVENIAIELLTDTDGTSLRDRSARRALEAELIRSRRPKFNVQGTEG